MYAVSRLFGVGSSEIQRALGAELLMSSILSNFRQSKQI